MDFWEKLVGRSHTKRGWLSDDHLDIWIEYLWQFRQPNDDLAMASPYLSDMLLWYEYPLYYANGVKYSVQWFAKSVKKVYFLVNESDSHWVLGELDITSGVITFYDSLGGAPGGVETRHFWLEVRQRLEFYFPLYLDSAKVFEKKKINKASYAISFQYAEGVPLQGGLYGDCGLWVCIFLYRLSHNIPLEVDDSSNVALAWREHSSDDKKGPSKASVPIFEGPSVQQLLDHYGYNDIEEYLSWNYFPSTDKKNTNKDMTDKDITDEDCIHESNYVMSKEKAKGEKKAVIWKLIMNQTLCLHLQLAFAACICSLHLQLAFAACICSLHSMCTQNGWFGYTFYLKLFDYSKEQA
ncbi:ulp1 protease family, C-terminal catalytic domain-containing protein [Tanacetum coccineum]